MFVITGGAGFIGSNVAAALDRGHEDIVIVDSLGTNDFKWRNIAKRRLYDIVPPQDCFAFLERHRRAISGIVHMGAISTTTETDVDAIVANNFRFSVAIWNLCADAGLPLVYASSAATYGMGTHGFDDAFDDASLSALRPLNPYGWSKHVFDRFVLRAVTTGAKTPRRWAGLKFFNVYGPNEYHKGGQRSVAVQLYEQIRASGTTRLFRSDNPAYADGQQLRDFVHVDDCVEVISWFLENETAPSGLYNVGSGVARPFADKAKILFALLGLEPRIEFVDLPANLRGKYQYYTCAPLEKLRAAGYDRPMTTLAEGLQRYVCDYLDADDRYR